MYGAGHLTQFSYYGIQQSLSLADIRKYLGSHMRFTGQRPGRPSNDCS